jgi:hypothetical protein
MGEIAFMCLAGSRLQQAQLHEFRMCRWQRALSRQREEYSIDPARKQ